MNMFEYISLAKQKIKTLFARYKKTAYGEMAYQAPGKVVRTVNRLKVKASRLKASQPGLVRILAAVSAAVMVFSVGYEIFNAWNQSAGYDLDDDVESILFAKRPDLAPLFQTDAQAQIISFNKNYSPSASAAGQNIPRYTAQFSMDPAKGSSITDPTSGASVKFIPKFRLKKPVQDENRLIYPLQGSQAIKVVTTATIGYKEDIILAQKEDDYAAYSYEIELPAGVEARLEQDGSLGFYGVDSSLLGNVSTGSDEDAELLESALANGEKKNLLFRSPPPYVVEKGKNLSSASAWYTLEDNTLTLHASGLHEAQYPLSIDPSIYIESAAQLMRGNNETNIDFNVANELIQKGSTTGARFDEWNTTMALNEGLWNHATATTGGYVYAVGGASSNVTTAIYSASGADTFEVPDGVTSVTVKMWGGGGGGGGGSTNSAGGAGGGGGFSQATVSVTPSETLSVFVGGGGGAGNFSSGGAGQLSGDGGGGGGHSAVERSGTPLVIAAGGGGGGGGDNSSAVPGGGGGAGGGTDGSSGGASSSAPGGGGGSQSSGGGGGNGSGNDGASGGSESGGDGGNGGGDNGCGNGGMGNGGTSSGGDGGTGDDCGNGFGAGGGGGSGYFGGGGGSASIAGNAGGGGGGGGSGLVTGTSTTLTGGSGSTPGNDSDGQRAGAGEGGSGGSGTSSGDPGNDGRIIISYSTATDDNISYGGSAAASGTSTTLDIDSPGNNRLVVIMASDESSGINLTGATVDGKDCNLVTRANNGSGAGNHTEMWYCDEDDLGGSSGSVTVAVSGGDAGWAIHAHLYTGAAQTGPSDFGIDDTSVSGSTVTVNNINVPEDGVAIMAAGNGQSGTWNTWTSPLTERTDGPNPASAVLGTASGIETSAQTNKTYTATASVGDILRGSAIVASWDHGIEGASMICDPTGDAFYEKYDGISGTAIEDLYNDADWPDNPSSTQTISSGTLSTPINIDDNFGGRLSALICPPQDGDYTFYVNGDDGTELRLSSDTNPANVSVIAEVPGWTSVGEWDKYTEQESSPISLNAGQYYYIEANYKEGTGGDHAQIGWTLPDTTDELPIPDTRYSMPDETDELILGPGSGNTVSPSVYWAQLSPTNSVIESPNPGAGACADWCTNDAYNLPDERIGHSMVAYNGFLYVIGGEDSSGNRQNEVYIAKLGANGEPSLWHPTDTNKNNWVYWWRDAGTNLPDELSYTAAAAYNNRLYIIGGQTDANPGGVGTVLYAELSPTGDVAGSWTSTGMASLPSVRHMHSVEVYNDYIYLIGGNSGGSLADTVHYARLNQDGTMNDWVGTTGFDTGRSTWGGKYTTVWGGYIYLSGGCSAVNGGGYCTTVEDDIQLASINADGSLDDWNSILNLTNNRMGYGLEAWRNAVYRVGGCLAQDAGNGDCTSVTPNAHFGIINQDGDASTVRISSPSGSGDCTGGEPFNCDLPPVGDGAGEGGQMLSVSAIMNGHLYAIGGCVNFGCTDVSGNVSYAEIASDGTLSRPENCIDSYYGAWCVDSTNQVNGTTGVAAAGVAVFGGQIYLVGGLNGSSNTNAIYRNSVNDDGSLAGAWTSQAMSGGGGVGATSVAYTYAYARANPASAGTNPGNLFIFGGCTSTSGAGCTASGYATQVYKCNIQSSGAISGCTTSGQLQIDSDPDAGGNQGLGIHSGTVYANYIYLVGGFSQTESDKDTVIYARIDDNNNVVAVSGGQWVESPNTMAIGRRRGFSFGYNGYLYAVGGFEDVGGGTIIEDIEFAKVDVSDGSIGEFNTSAVTINQRWGLGMAVSNSYAYVIGGCDVGNSPSACSSFEPAVQTFQIYNNDSGSPAGYSAGDNLFGTDRLGGSAAVVDGYIYIAGGCISTGDCTNATNSVQYAQLDAYGDIGTWSATTDDLPADRAWGQLEAAGGSLYYIGGQGNSAADERAEVYYATPSSGDITSWSTASNGLPSARTRHGAAVWNDRIYVTGGRNSSGTLENTVYISPQLSSGGNITSAWTSDADTFDVPRSGHTTIAYANNLYVLGGYDGANYLSDVQFAQINSDGTVDPWSFTTSLPTPLRHGDGFAANGYMYMFGGRSDATSCASKTLVAPISANTTIDTGNNPTGIGEWYETNERYNGDRYGAAATYHEGKAYVLGGGCFTATITEPSIASQNSQTFTSDTTTHNVTMPATVDAGDLLLVLFSSDGSATVSDPDGAGGWTQIDTLTRSTFARGSVWAKVAVGNEDSTNVNFVTSAGEQAVAHVYRITADSWEGTLAGGIDSASADPGGTTSTPNPPALNPSAWGTENTLWLAFAAGSSWSGVSSYPSGYTNGAHNITGTGTANSSASSARRIAAVASEDPGAFTMTSTNSGVVFTVGIRPVPPDSTTVLEDDFDPGIDGSQWIDTGSTVADTECDSNSGNSLRFTGNDRVAETQDVDVAYGGTISFYLYSPSGGGGNCETPDAGEDMALEYSTNNGSNWTAINTYPSDVDPITLITEEIPAGAMTDNTRFRWRQTADSGAGFDHWAIDEMQVDAFDPPDLTLTGADRVVQTALLSQPQVAKYSRMIDTDTDVFPNRWLMNGVDNSIGARWQTIYRSSTSGNAEWGQETDFGDTTLGTVNTYVPLDGSGVDTEFARYFYFSVEIDASQTYGYPDDVERGPTITDITLFFTADPAKRLRHGKTFTGGEKQPLDTPPGP